MLELGRLSLREHDLGYLVQRLARAFSRRPAVSAWGLQYRLCETGPAKLDPRLLTAALQRLSESRRSPGRPLPGLLTDPTLKPDAQADAVATCLEAADLVRRATGNLNSVRITRALGLRGQTRANPRVSRQTDTSTETSTAYRRIVDDIPLEVQSIVTQSKESAAMHVWILNDLRWLYPDNPRLWRLLRTRALADAVVLVIARKIAPITFHLFKTLGVRGVQFYSLLCESEPSEAARNAADTLGLPHLLPLKELRNHAVIKQIRTCQETLNDRRGRDLPSATKAAMASAERRGFGTKVSPNARDLLNWTQETELEWPPAWSQTLLAWAERRSLPLQTDSHDAENFDAIDVDDPTPIDAPGITGDQSDRSYRGDGNHDIVSDPTNTVVMRGRVVAEVDRETWDKICARSRTPNDGGVRKRKVKTRAES